MNCASFCDKLKPLPLSWRPVSASSVSGWIYVCVCMCSVCTARYVHVLFAWSLLLHSASFLHLSTDCAGKARYNRLSFAMRCTVTINHRPCVRPWPSVICTLNNYEQLLCANYIRNCFYRLVRSAQ